MRKTAIKKFAASLLFTSFVIGGLLACTNMDTNSFMYCDNKEIPNNDPEIMHNKLNDKSSISFWKSIKRHMKRYLCCCCCKNNKLEFIGVIKPEIHVKLKKLKDIQLS
jgi:hypothetical protein